MYGWNLSVISRQPTIFDPFIYQRADQLLKRIATYPALNFNMNFPVRRSGKLGMRGNVLIQGSYYNCTFSIPKALQKLSGLYLLRCLRAKLQRKPVFPIPFHITLRY